MSRSQLITFCREPSRQLCSNSHRYETIYPLQLVRNYNHFTPTINMASCRTIIPKFGDVVSGFLANCRHSTTNSCIHQQAARLPTDVVSSASWTGRLRWTWQNLKSTCDYQLNIIADLFAKQCNAIAAQRIRRTGQIFHLYTKLYDRNSVKRVFEKFQRQFLRNGKVKPIHFLLSAALFSWEQEKIKDTEIKECESDLQHLKVLRKSSAEQLKEDRSMDTWENVMNADNLKVWRKPVDGTNLYEYKVFGSFYDVTARDFYSVQVDLDYRKKWDKLVIDLERIDEDPASECEVVHWVTHYPYPMYSRDYVYISKHKIDYENNMMVIVSRATNHPLCPETKKYVRVKTYNSNMVIMPHASFDENGFDYLLNYCDDPRAHIPNAAYNWMASSGVPDFVEKLRVAAKQLSKSGNTTNISQGRETDYSQNDRGAVPM